MNKDKSENNKSTSEVYRSRMKLARISLMCFSVFSVINYILALAKSSFVFVFSAFIPQYLLSFGNYASNMLGNSAHTAVFTVISAVYVFSALLCSSLSLRYAAFIIPSAMILLSDCLFMSVHFSANYKLIISTNFVGMLLHIIFHAICAVYCIFGTAAYLRLKKDNIKDKQPLH